MRGAGGGGSYFSFMLNCIRDDASGENAYKHVPESQRWQKSMVFQLGVSKLCQNLHTSAADSLKQFGLITITLANFPIDP